MNPGFRRYAQTQAQTASPERTMVMLFDAALKHMRTAAVDFDQGQVQPALKAVGKASDIVAALQGTLRTDVAPELCQSLSDVYSFVLNRLTIAMLRRQATAVREAERVFAPVGEAFGQAVVIAQGGKP